MSQIVGGTWTEVELFFNYMLSGIHRVKPSGNESIFVRSSYFSNHILNFFGKMLQYSCVCISLFILETAVCFKLSMIQLHEQFCNRRFTHKIYVTRKILCKPKFLLMCFFLSFFITCPLAFYFHWKLLSPHRLFQQVQPSHSIHSLITCHLLQRNVLKNLQNHS